MNLAFENARKVIEAVDAPKPFETVSDLVVEGAPFLCQAGALADVTTVKGWFEWMMNFATNIAPGCKPTVHCMAWDKSTKTAAYYATYNAKHTGSGGPLEATNKETNTDYAYFLTMNDDDKVSKFVKVWNDGYCLKELGWAE